MKTVAFLLGLFAPVCAFAQSPEYVGSDQCVECHTAEVEAWSESHHALAWTRVEDWHVVADFDGTRFDHDGMLTEFSKTGDSLQARVTEKDGSTTHYDLHSVVGIEPLQQYLFETEPGRLQSFDVVWDTGEQRWYHLYPDQDLPPDDGLHWTGPYKNWNARCAECHATGFKKNYDAQTRSYSSVQAEIGVGCEACHGPSSAHIDWTRGEGINTDLSAFGFTMDWGKGRTKVEIQQCAGCHSRREAHGDGNPVPGTPYHDAYNLSVLRPGLYHPDGQILDEVYVYGSFLQSKMYAEGVGCMNCHDPHSVELKAEGNGVCTQCHSPAGNPDFPTLTAKEYDTPAHHHHPDESAGAQCVSCHMIERVYMGVDWRRDHSFRIPRPDLGLGQDACTDCHKTEDQAWAAQRIEEWFPDSTHRGTHFGTTFQAALSGQANGPDALLEIAADPNMAGIVRATAAYLLQPFTSAEVAVKTEPLLTDADPLVRANAVPLQRQAALPDMVARLEPLMSDPIRNVRISTAKEFLNIPQQVLSRDQQTQVAQSMAEWQGSIANRLDFPETHLVLGGMALTFRNAPAAERAFREVVSLDPQRAEAWPMLVQLAQINRGIDAARNVLQEGLTVLPDDPGLLQLKAQLVP
ncbi:Formate-dependent nitrite reductase, periplasmic cytochrome c552 subunit [Ruegeria denitrificans]|uniref:Formate-dependent nitrite reductase, periplasmic cytochrome c552 subunit n=1 Tax=Ruegeria denitrificans TaxID=1715692 RepID=A0A0P1I7A5_9RHOB|nr:multiheme c-type cytochrome [Ruegeria denitrificans]CUJ94817.1 Formate-dependent nitrite reductase, periplasmic cytochrome c552 subunit [Ruegeria denitrificans]